MDHPTAGIGFKPKFFDEAMASPAAGLWFEVHAENYMVDGGPRLSMLDALAARFPVSLHGVGLSLAGVQPPCPRQLAALRRLADRIGPCLISEHLAWSRLGSRCFPDLLPFPRTDEALAIVARNIDIMQTALGRPILIENPALYFDVGGHDWPEPEFLAALCRQTGCGLLIDINNIIVSASNLRFNAYDWIDAVPQGLVGEYHLAGHSEDPLLGAALLVDSHDTRVAAATWSLFGWALDRLGPAPALIERDDNLPGFDALMIERGFATALLADAAAMPEQKVLEHA